MGSGFCALRILTRYVPTHTPSSGTETANTKTRHVPGAVDGIRAALQWSGLEYDYGTRMVPTAGRII